MLPEMTAKAQAALADKQQAAPGLRRLHLIYWHFGLAGIYGLCQSHCVVELVEFQQFRDGLQQLFGKWVLDLERLGVRVPLNAHCAILRECGISYSRRGDI